MSLESPATYGEWYWKLSIDANKEFADESEKAIAPYLAGLFAEIPDIRLLPEGVQRFIKGIQEPASFAFLPFMAGVGVNAIDEMLDVAFEPALLSLKRAYGKRFKSKWLTTEQVNLLWSRKKITAGLWNEVIEADGYEDVLGSALFESQLPYPSIPDIVSYSRYHGPPDAPWGEFQDWYNISPREWPVWKWLGQQKLTSVQVQSLFKRGTVTETDALNELARIGWSSTDRRRIIDLGYLLPNALLQVQGNLMQDITDDRILVDISRSDIHPNEATKYLDAVLTKPASLDIVSYQLRKDPELSGLPKELRRIGIHPAYHELYKELAYQIPPVADIITMAVREAFSPEIAVRFGQYEDFPPELAEWAGKKGLSKEWAERYWAAHWALPSSQQGFAMLHRGVITEPELHLLLRAQDVMPFWRDKLTQIAYRPLTRVDVRRMYKQGVLTEREVYESYLDQGYAEENAERMAEFTVKQTLASLSKFTSSDIIKAFSSRMISSGEAMSLLRDIGIRSEDASYIISTAEYKRVWAFTDDQTAGIRNLYKRRIYTENQARDKLARLNLPSDQINVLMEQWYFEKVEELDATWTTAQTIKFLKRKLISPERAERELTLIGYDPEHIDVYMKDLQWTQPKD